MNVVNVLQMNLYHVKFYILLIQVECNLAKIGVTNEDYYNLDLT